MTDNSHRVVLEKAEAPAKRKDPSLSELGMDDMQAEKPVPNKVTEL